MRHSPTLHAMTESRVTARALAVLIVLAIVAWYSMHYTGAWHVRRAAMRIELPQSGFFAVWSDRQDAARIAVVWFESADAPASVLTIDRSSGQRSRTTFTVEQLRARYQPFSTAIDPQVRVVLRGIDIPRPELYARIFGESSVGIERGHSLFGRIDVVDGANGQVLVSRYVINGRRLQGPDELASISPDRRLVAIITDLYSQPRTVWLFPR